MMNAKCFFVLVFSYATYTYVSIYFHKQKTERTPGTISSRIHFNEDRDLQPNIYNDMEKLFTLSDERKIFVGDSELDLREAMPYAVFTENATYTVDDEPENIPDPVTYTTDTAAGVIFFSETYQGVVDTISIFQRDTGKETFLTALGDGIFTSESQDRDVAERLGLLNPGNEGSPFDQPESESSNDSNDRDDTNNLRSSSITNPCDEYKVVELAVAYDSTFCDKLGGSGPATAEVMRIITGVSAKYQQAGLCTMVRLSHLEGYCNKCTDPYKELVDTGISGCHGTSGGLQDFKVIWNNEKTDVSRTAAHLFTGKSLECDFEEGCTIGCSYTGTICRPRAYGVNHITFSRDKNLRIILVAHELGHNLGSEHYYHEGFIMNTLVDVGNLGFNFANIDRMNAIMEDAECIHSIPSDEVLPAVVEPCAWEKYFKIPILDMLFRTNGRHRTLNLFDTYYKTPAFDMFSRINARHR